MGEPTPLTDAEVVQRAASAITATLRALEPDAQADAIRALGRDQSALFGFWVLYAHSAHGLSGFCREMPHRADDPNFWRLVEGALSHLGDHDLLALVRRLPAAMPDPKAMLSLDAEYGELAPRSLARAARLVRARPAAPGA